MTHYQIALDIISVICVHQYTCRPDYNGQWISLNLTTRSRIIEYIISLVSKNWTCD